MNCVDHPKPLTPDSSGVPSCPLCGSGLLSSEDLSALGPNLLGSLQLETREKSGAFARTRTCPQCAVPMAPWRIGTLEAWLERCPSCEHYWADTQDRRTLLMSAKSHARVQAFKSLPASDRKDLARDLAEATSVEPESPDLSPIQLALGVVGIPVVSRTRGNRIPWATWSLSALFLGMFLLGLLAPDTFGAEVIAWYTASPGALGLLTATFAHFGWLHLLGNVGFLLAFGDGVEQMAHRGLYVLVFFLIAAAATVSEAAVSGPETLIGGASGGVAGVMGACLVLQPRARVVFLLRLTTVEIPLPVYALFYLAIQVSMLMTGSPGVAWTAHVTGLLLGVTFGLALRWTMAGDSGHELADV